VNENKIQLESLTQTSADARQQEESQEIWGRPPRGSETAKVKAYVGPLPEGSRGVEFATDIEPDLGTPPGHAYWSGLRSGVRLKGDFAILKVSSVINCQP
jgi:hypothetical protein